VASEARRQGWRVVAFAFGEAPALDHAAHRTIPSQLTDVSAVLDGLRREQVSAVVFAGKVWKRDLLEEAAAADSPGRELLSAAGGLSDRALAEAVVATLGSLGIEILDQRTFLAPLLVPPGLLTPRSPSEEEWRDIRLGLALGRQCSAFGVGQTMVLKQGVVVAVEGIEGTSETIRRGARLAGPGAVVVKAVALQQDYRFDVPTVGAETVQAMIEGRAAVLAVESRRVLLVERDAALALAAQNGIAVVSLDADGG
jgi:DUF1009 family protein